MSNDPDSSFEGPIPQRDQFFQAIESKVRNAVEIIQNELLLDSDIFKSFSTTITESLLKIEVCSREEFLKRFVSEGDNYDEMLKKFRKAHGNVYQMTARKDGISRIHINVDAYRENPKEIEFLMEDILEQVAGVTALEFSKHSVDTLFKNEELRNSLPPTTHSIEDIHQAFVHNTLNPADYILNEIGFGAIVVSEVNNHFENIGDIHEKIRVDLIKTLLLVKYFGKDHPGSEIDKVTEGIRELGEKARNEATKPYYFHETLCFLFISNCIHTESTTAKSPSKSKMKFELKSLLTNLTTQRYSYFYKNYLSKHNRAAFNELVSIYRQTT